MTVDPRRANTEPMINRPGVSPADSQIGRWIDAGFIQAEDWEGIPRTTRAELEAARTPILCEKLVEHGLLTEYQAARLKSGKLFGLILGNFRVLDRLGVGGMGVVFKAEHITMRRLAAVKVLSFLCDEDPHLVLRFKAEMRAVAQLQHPNIVSAFDAGTLRNEAEGLTAHYFVMEYVEGRDLDDWVQAEGPLTVLQACDVAYQVATALTEAHKHHLVHRDIKPANIIVTPERHAKLLDFGLARHFGHRMTEPGTVVGTIDYMAPEQARDSSTVDIRADIFGLGATLFWALTGRPPFEPRASLELEIIERMTQPAPAVRTVRPDIPAGLDEVIGRMLAVDPVERFPHPEAVMKALFPYLQAEGGRYLRAEGLGRTERVEGSPQTQRVLVVDDEAGIRSLTSTILKGEGLECDEAAGGTAALEALASNQYDLVLLDVDMPGMSGLEVLRRIRERPTGHLKVIMMSGRVQGDALAQTLLGGADDFLSKPFSLVQLCARVKTALRLHQAQTHSDSLNRQLMTLAADQELALHTRDSDLVHARNALVLALAKLVECRTNQSGAHLMRLQNYTRCLAEVAAGVPAFAGQIDESFLQLLICCAPLYDIGKVGLPDHILQKPGKLTAEERLIMQTHTTIGADTLKGVFRQNPFAKAFLHVALVIVRHHHERWDGAGYPDQLAGNSIPLAARLFAPGEVYDALRCRRSYKPALSHIAALQLMKESTGQFDPTLLALFIEHGNRFAQIFQDLPN